MGSESASPSSELSGESTSPTEAPLEHFRRRGKSRRRWKWFRRVAIVIGVGLIVLAGLAYPNRVEWGARAMVTAPNQGQTLDPNTPKTQTSLPAGVSRVLRISVGPPDAVLSAWIVEPPSQPPRGTILYFHGIYDRKDSLLPTALSHASRGYRGVLVDSRGHGESTGQWLTYGAQEVADYRQLLDELQRQGLLAGRVAIYAASYGAGVGIQLAGRDERITTVVALAPFASMHAVVHARARSLGLTWILSKADIDAAITRAGNLAGFDPSASDGIAAMNHRSYPVLVIHGRKDNTIPFEQGAAVQAAGAPDSRLVPVDEATHEHWTAAGSAAIWLESTAWFDRWLADR